jgi:hypothetical protein
MGYILFIIVFVVTPVALFVVCLVCLILGCIEFNVSGRLKKHAKEVKGYVTYVDIKAERALIGSHIYGKVEFTYQVNDVTYCKRQTVDGLTARVLLPRESREVTVLFLPQKPSVARLFMARRDYKRIHNFTWALGFLGFIVLFILFLLLIAISNQPNY